MTHAIFFRNSDRSSELSQWKAFPRERFIFAAETLSETKQQKGGEDRGENGDKAILEAQVNVTYDSNYGLTLLKSNKTQKCYQPHSSSLGKN